MSYIDDFVQAVMADDETHAEKLIYSLQPADEVVLLSLLRDPISFAAKIEMSVTDANLSDLRWWAVRALAHCGTAASAPLLAQLLDDSTSGDEANLLCATASLAFGHLHQREPKAVEPYLRKLAAQLSHTDGFVRQAASDALALCGDSAVQALEEVLAGTNDGARSRAAYALRKIGSMAVASALFQHLNDPHYLVRLHAYEGLDAMGLLDNLLLEV